MFMAADWVVKAVMVGLAIASLLTWTVLVSKTIELNALKRLLRHNRNKITAAHTLADAANATDIVGVGREFIEAAEAELDLSVDLVNKEGGKEGIKERVVSSLSRIEASSTRRMLVGTGLLATIGSVGPFVGLFGTVWGIMNSFISISQANTTNLAVVAPGIAEALLATGLGLVAAIPAVVIYNHFTRQIAGAKTLAADSAAAVIRLVSRDLDRGISLQVAQPAPTKIAK
jgi:biopolymer transport protein ExbB